MYLDVYIARPESLPQEPWSAGSSRLVLNGWSDSFPGGRCPFWALHEGVDSGEWQGIHIDHATTVVAMDKATIQAFMDRIYTPDAEASFVDHQSEVLRRLREFVDRLQEGVRYAVVASEL